MTGSEALPGKVEAGNRGLSLLLALVAALLLAVSLCAPPVQAQDGAGGNLMETVVPSSATPELEAPGQVQVQPTAQDDEIRQRLEDILQATNWYVDPQVAVQEGVVFLEGRTGQEDYRTWAGDLARNTENVVAVVNRIQVIERSPWDFSLALDEVRSVIQDLVVSLPQIGFGLLVLLFTWLLAKLVRRGGQRLLQGSIENPLLRDVAARALTIPIFIVGIYLVLQFFGLTRLALTVLGGTGLAGLVVGIAFSDIVENFLASLLISLRNPFEVDDMIQVAGYTGIVQRVTTRGTILMGLDGNHIQIPNATIYKSNIVNYTANPNRRVDFMVGIDYEDSIAGAQDLILALLARHPAVLATPEPLVLAENLAPSTVDLHVYFWINGNQHDILKVKSSVMRMTKQTLLSSGFSMPDSAREVVFPRGVPIGSTDEQSAPVPRGGFDSGEGRPGARGEPVSTAGEGALTSEDEQIREQARNARVPEQGMNLLEPRSSNS